MTAVTDAAGNLVQKGEDAAGTPSVTSYDHEVAYEYDAAGNRKSIEVPGGATAITSYTDLRSSALGITAGARTDSITSIVWYPSTRARARSSRPTTARATPSPAAAA